jgi:hypothetical protein
MFKRNKTVEQFERCDSHMFLLEEGGGSQIDVQCDLKKDHLGSRHESTIEISDGAGITGTAEQTWYIH